MGYLYLFIVVQARATYIDRQLRPAPDCGQRRAVIRGSTETCDARQSSEVGVVYRVPIGLAVLQLKESGDLQKLHKKWWRTSDE